MSQPGPAGEAEELMKDKSRKKQRFATVEIQTKGWSSCEGLEESRRRVRGADLWQLRGTAEVRVEDGLRQALAHPCYYGDNQIWSERMEQVEENREEEVPEEER